MAVWKYKELIPRVVVSRLRLLDPKEIANLADRTLDSVYSVLTSSPYREEISEIPVDEHTSMSLQEALLRNFVRTCKELVDYSPKQVARLISATLIKFEIDAAKTLLRAKWAGMEDDEALRYATPVGKLDEARFRAILNNSQEIDDVVKNLSAMGYGSDLAEHIARCKEMGQLLPLEVALERHIYERIWKALGRLRGLDRKISESVIGIEIDSKNIQAILRCKEMGISKEQVGSLLMPITEVLGQQELSDAVEAKDVSSTIERLLVAARLAVARDYRYVLVDLLEEYAASHTLLNMELVLEKGLLKTCMRMLKRYPTFFNIGLILAYLNLKWFEARNLRIIVRGLDQGVPAGKIRPLLVLPD